VIPIKSADLPARTSRNNCSRSNLISSKLIEVWLCNFDWKNFRDLYVNQESMKGAMQQLSSLISEHCAGYKPKNIRKNSALGSSGGDEIFLSLHSKKWYRVKSLSPGSKKLLSIDHGIQFESSVRVECPERFKSIPPFAIGVSLAGVDDDTKQLNCDLLKHFVNVSRQFKMRIMHIDDQKFHIELFNDQKVSLNHLLNPNFQREFKIKKLN
jgi:hypothetical protein